jgi:hypothetical protein
MWIHVGLFGIASAAQLIYLGFKSSPTSLREVSVWGALLAVCAAGLFGLWRARKHRIARSIAASR